MASRFISSHPTIKRYLFPDTSTSITLSSGEDTYALPSDYSYQIHRVVYDPSSTASRELGWIPLEKVHGFQNSVGQVLYYHPRGTDIILADVPAAADAGKTLQVLYAQKDGSYVNDATETTLGARYPHLLVNKVVYELSVTEQDGEIAAVNDRIGKAFEQGMEQAIQELSQSGTTEGKSVQISRFGEPL